MSQVNKCETCYHWNDVVCQLFDSPHFKKRRYADMPACPWYWAASEKEPPVYEICESTKKFIATLPSDSQMGPRLFRLVDEIERLRIELEKRNITRLRYQVQLLGHACGMYSSEPFFRDHFAAEPGSGGDGEFAYMVQHGLAEVRHEPGQLSPFRIYGVTDKGKELIQSVSTRGNK